MFAGPTSVGFLSRRGLEKSSPLRRCRLRCDCLTRAGLNTSQAVEKIREEVPACAEVEELLEFIAASPRGVIKGRG